MVFIEGGQEGNVACWRYREREGGLEERQVFYGGMTRAEERSYVSSVLNRDQREEATPLPLRRACPRSMSLESIITDRGEGADT